MLEIIVVGGGPAGITACIYLARKKMNFLLLTLDVGGQTLMSAGIENYVGHQYITGPELAAKFAAHLKEFTIGLKENEEVRRVERGDGFFKVYSAGGEYRAKSVIVCTGRKPRKLSVPGEEEFYNRGITYCATCDGPVFAGKRVAVVGGGNSGLEVALQMVRISSRVYIVERNRQLTGDGILIDRLKGFPNVEILTGSSITGIRGERFVKEISVSGDTRGNIPVEGVLVEIGSVPNSHIAEGVEKNGSGEIIVDCGTRTSVPGLFASGDVTNVFKKQIIIACGEGAKSAIAASEYINSGK